MLEPAPIGQKLDIISGATVTVMVIDDSVRGSAQRMARSRVQPAAAVALAEAAPTIDATVPAPADWAALLTEGAVAGLRLTVADVDRAMAQAGAGGAPTPGTDPSAADAGRAVQALPGAGHAVVTPVAVIALQEVKNGLRNRWVLAATLLLAVLALSLTLLGSVPTGAVKVSALTVTVVSLASLTVFLVPLIALLLAYEAIVGEAERGTLLLLLAYPVARHQVLLGKFLGHLLILVMATVVGYGAAGVAVGLRGDTDPAAWMAFAALLSSSIVLGAAFLAIGYLLSALVRERATAAGLALGIWLLLVIVYDTALLGLLVADGGQFVTPHLFGALLLLNPSDAFRLLNLAGFADARMVAGLAGVDAGPAGHPAAALGALAAWVLLPLGLAGWLLARREI